MSIAVPALAMVYLDPGFPWLQLVQDASNGPSAWREDGRFPVPPHLVKPKADRPGLLEAALLRTWPIEYVGV